MPTAVVECVPSAKLREEEDNEITPATTVPTVEEDAESDCDSFCQTDSEDEHPQQLQQGPPPPPMDDAVPRQLQQGPPPPPMDDAVPRQLQQGPPPPTSDDCDDVSTTRSSTPRECEAGAKVPCQGGGPFSFEETFFVFDYDDTILPSTWISRQKLRLDSASQTTPEQMAALGEVAEIAGKTLRLARQHGTVIFITNAERGWIELSCQKFMPTLAPMLENIRLISARTSYEGPLAPSPLDWKLRAFEDQLSHHFGGEALADASKRKNVFSFGDGIHEREALLTSTATLPNCAAKSLKFVERPDISQIIKQHELISGAFESIVHQQSNLDLKIRCP